MNGLEHVLVIFAVVQTAFVVLDLLTLSRDARRGTLPALRQVGLRTAAFLAGVWLVYFVIQTALMALVPGVDEVVGWLAGIVAVAEPAAAPSWALLPLLAATWVVAGFWDYALHRWLLHTRCGWFLHENHHLPTVVANGVPGISVRPFVAVTTFLTYLGTAAVMLGVMTLTETTALVSHYLACVPVLILALTLVGSASHSAFLRRFPWVHGLLRPLLVTTPQEHLLHHGARMQGNYGNFTSLWDRVFGTYLRPVEDRGRALELGLTYDQDFLGTLTAGRFKLPPPVREQYRLDAFCRLNTWGASKGPPSPPDARRRPRGTRDGPRCRCRDSFTDPEPAPRRRERGGCPMTAHTILRAILVVVAVSHVVLGLLACVVGPGTAASLVNSLYGANLAVTPQLHHVIRILGAFMIAIGIMSAFAIRDPERNRAIVDGVGILQILRAGQRVVFASQIQEIFGMSSGRLMLQSAFFLLLGLALLLLRPHAAGVAARA